MIELNKKIEGSQGINMSNSETMNRKKFSSEEGYIFEIQKMSTEDGPGIRTTVFFKECPLKCVWCHNPESIEYSKAIQWFEAQCIGCEECLSSCPTHSLHFDDFGLVINRDTCNHCASCVDSCPTTALKASGEWITLDDLLDEILKDKAFYEKSGGGVTFSGGEPTLQVGFLEKILQLCNENHIHTALDTCGLSSKSIYSRLLPYVDLVLYDLKEIDPEKHKSFTGVSNSQILENCEWLAQEIKKDPSKKMWIRTPLIPNFTARDDNVIGIAQFILANLKDAVDRWDLLAFNNMAQAKYERLNLDWVLADTPLLTKDEMRHFHNLAMQVGLKNAQWDGLTRIE